MEAKTSKYGDYVISRVFLIFLLVVLLGDGRAFASQVHTFDLGTWRRVLDVVDSRYRNQFYPFKDGAKYGVFTAGHSGWAGYGSDPEFLDALPGKLGAWKQRDVTKSPVGDVLPGGALFYLGQVFAKQKGTQKQITYTEWDGRYSRWGQFTLFGLEGRMIRFGYNPGGDYTVWASKMRDDYKPWHWDRVGVFPQKIQGTPAATTATVFVLGAGVLHYAKLEASGSLTSWLQFRSPNMQTLVSLGDTVLGIDDGAVYGLVSLGGEYVGWKKIATLPDVPWPEGVFRRAIYKNGDLVVASVSSTKKNGSPVYRVFIDVLPIAGHDTQAVYPRSLVPPPVIETDSSPLFFRDPRTDLTGFYDQVHGFWSVQSAEGQLIRLRATPNEPAVCGFAELHDKLIGWSTEATYFISVTHTAVGFEKLPHYLGDQCTRWNRSGEWLVSDPNGKTALRRVGAYQGRIEYTPNGGEHWLPRDPFWNEHKRSRDQVPLYVPALQGFLNSGSGLSVTGDGRSFAAVTGVTADLSDGILRFCGSHVCIFNQDRHDRNPIATLALAPPYETRIYNWEDIPGSRFRRPRGFDFVGILSREGLSIAFFKPHGAFVVFENGVPILKGELEEFSKLRLYFASDVAVYQWSSFFVTDVTERILQSAEIRQLSRDGHSKSTPKSVVFNAPRGRPVETVRELMPASVETKKAGPTSESKTNPSCTGDPKVLCIDYTGSGHTPESIKRDNCPQQAVYSDAPCPSQGRRGSCQFRSSQPGEYVQRWFSAELAEDAEMECVLNEGTWFIN